MTSPFVSHPDHPRLQRQGWICSVLFHAIMGTCALALLSGLQMPIPPDQFTWNVAMVETPKPHTKADTLPESKPTPPKPQVVESQPSRSQPVTETIQRKVIQPVQAVSQIVQRQVTTVNQTASIVTHADRHSEISQTVATTIPRENVVQEEQDFTAHATVPQETAGEQVERPQQTATTLAPVVERAGAEPPGEPVAHAQRAAVEQTVAHIIATKQFPATKADYGWLMQALLGRVNQLKNYPHLARLNHWEGKVVLRAVIKDDGQVLMVDVHESSGRAILDNDAIETLRRASPLKLEHPLGKPQVAILMPISYSLR